MSHTSCVQQALPVEELANCPCSGVLLSVGMLGGEGQYVMPRSILEALAGCLGGMVVDSLPPFFIACTDGLVLVLTLACERDFVGGAFLIPADRLDLIDRQLGGLWSSNSRQQTADEFLEGTYFRLSGSTDLPKTIEEYWRVTLS